MMATSVTLFPQSRFVRLDDTNYTAIGLVDVQIEGSELLSALVLVINKQGELLTLPADLVKFVG